jgi:hypothetical protein
VQAITATIAGCARQRQQRTLGKREISSNAVFPPDEGRRLADFLESADLVKFAAFEPGREDVEESFRRAKVFIRLEKMEVAA